MFQKLSDVLLPLLLTKEMLIMRTQKESLLSVVFVVRSFRLR